MHSYVLRAFWKPTGFSISLTTKELFMEKLPSFAEHRLFVPSTPSLCPFPTCSDGLPYQVFPEQAVLLWISSLSLPRLLVNYTGKLLAWQPPGQALAGAVPLSEQNLGSIMR